MDKLALVTPVLGLYAELYACRAQSELGYVKELYALVQSAREAIFPKTFTPASDVRVRSATTASPTRSKPQRKLSMKTTARASSRADFVTVAISSPTIMTRESQYAPHEIEVEDVVADVGPPDVATHGSAETVRKALASPSAKVDKGVTMELFGNLVNTVQEIIDEDHELRKQLQQSVLHRREVKQQFDTGQFWSNLLATVKQESARQMITQKDGPAAAPAVLTRAHTGPLAPSASGRGDLGLLGRLTSRLAGH